MKAPLTSSGQGDVGESATDVFFRTRRRRCKRPGLSKIFQPKVQGGDGEKPLTSSGQGRTSVKAPLKSARQGYVSVMSLRNFLTSLFNDSSPRPCRGKPRLTSAHSSEKSCQKHFFNSYPTRSMSSDVIANCFDSHPL